MADDPILRTTLIVAALRLLEASGEEPSLRAVARAAKVSAMAPYNHFANKADLLAAVANHGFQQLGETLKIADDKPEPREALIAQGIAFVEFARSNPALFRLMYSHHYGSADMASVQATNTILADRVAEILPTESSAAALACRSLVQGMSTVILNGRLSPSKANDIPIAIRLLVLGLEAGRMESSL